MTQAREYGGDFQAPNLGTYLDNRIVEYLPEDRFGEIMRGLTADRVRFLFDVDKVVLHGGLVNISDGDACNGNQIYSINKVLRTGSEVGLRYGVTGLLQPSNARFDAGEYPDLSTRATNTVDYLGVDCTVFPTIMVYDKSQLHTVDPLHFNLPLDDRARVNALIRLIVLDRFVTSEALAKK